MLFRSRRPLKLTSAFESFLPWLVIEFDRLPSPDHENHDVRLPKIDEGLDSRRVSDEANDELRIRVVSGEVGVTVKPLLADGFWVKISVDNFDGNESENRIEQKLHLVRDMPLIVVQRRHVFGNCCKPRLEFRDNPLMAQTDHKRGDPR